MNDDKIFAAPEKVEDVADCYFYHTMELPGYGVINGDWDLRHGVDDYLGNVTFAGKRVLEIGPASGFLAFEMEKRGAEVVSIEVTAEHAWDFVPYPAKRLDEVFGPRRIVMQQLKNSYWFSHAALQSKARVYYGDVYNLPTSHGQFDIAVMGSVLLHCRDPLRIVKQCGRIARTLIIVDIFTRTWKARPFAASRRRLRISCGIRGGISVRSFSLNFWPSWDSPRQKFQNTNRITGEERTHFLLS
jgi:SAM-dependent methyltransferase